MNRYDLAIALLTEVMMESAPSGTDYLTVRENIRHKVSVVIQNIRDKLNGKE